MDTTDIESDSVTTSATVEQRAEMLKDQGNVFYKQGHYHKAIRHYSEAIELTPTNKAYYGNRSAALFMIQQWNDCEKDCNTATSLDPSFIKCYLRAGNCYLHMGDLESARAQHSLALLRDPLNSEALEGKESIDKISRTLDAALQRINSGDPQSALLLSESVLAKSEGLVRAIFIKARAKLLQKEYGEVASLMSTILQKDNSSSEALCLRGKALFYQGNVRQAVSHFSSAVRLDPDNQDYVIPLKKARQLEAKKKEGNDLYAEKKYSEAVERYSEALSVDLDCSAVNSLIHANKAQALVMLNRNSEAVEELNKALDKDPKYLKALLRRAGVHLTLEHYQEAVYDFEKAKQLDPHNKDIKKQLREAQVELKKSQRKDYYKILGMEKHASEAALKKAYRKQALLWHPDKHQGDDKDDAEKKFKDIGEAYAVLSDPEKRRRYDSGQDLDGSDPFGNFGAGNAQDIFSTFMESMGGMGGMGGMPGYSFGGGGGPRTFSFNFG